MNDTAPGHNFQSSHDQGDSDLDVPTRKSNALKTAREICAAGTTCDSMSSSAHMKYKTPSATKRTCAHLSTRDETI